jgi:hypothetical protein
MNNSRYDTCRELFPALKYIFPKLTDISVRYRVAVEQNISNKCFMKEIVLNNDICDARN